MRPKVVIAETISQTGIDALGEHCDVHVAAGVSRADLLESVADANGLIVRSETNVDAELIRAAPILRVVGRAGVGVDNIDLRAATAAGILVVNAPQANIISAAEHTMALLLAQARNVAPADASMRAGRWDREKYQGIELHGKILGVVGLGRIGSLVAQRALSFGMRIIAFDPYVSSERGRRLGVEVAGHLDDLLAEADFITVHLPLNKQTLGLIGSESIAKMKDGVRIINTSRGGIVDEQALVDAVLSGKVAGAGLDVFHREPLADSPLRDVPEIVLTPHLGASTVEAQDKAGVDVADAVGAALRGELVLSAVNVDLGRNVADETREFLGVAEYLGAIFCRVAHGLPDRLVVRTEGRIAGFPIRPLRMSALKGAFNVISSAPVSFVNVESLAAESGLAVEEEASTESDEFVSLLRLSGVVAGRAVSIAGTMGRKGPHLVSIFGHDVELLMSRHMLLIRNSDVPGVIGRVGTYLGDIHVNIANMAVGQSPETGSAAMMGLSLDKALDEEQMAGLRALEGVEEAQQVELPI
ncbi:MAG TPA: phosphoglycerate dehydrogenase [Acidimicrobiia bacterium]|nr:phosphoglycerate dehydrogenase [Acidimicrobiia bacterium]